MNEWPELDDLRKIKKPDDVNLKELMFLGSSQHLQDRMGVKQVRCGIKVSNQIDSSPRLTPSCLDKMKDVVDTENIVSLDFIY